MGDLVIAADFGTSGVKVGVVDESLSIVARVVEAYPLSLQAGGIAEQNPMDWWAALSRAISNLRAEVPDLSKRAGALVFCSQICNTICVDETGKPLRPCITWLDKRAADDARDLIGGSPSVLGYNLFKLASWLRLANGAPARNGMDQPSKLKWISRNEPEVLQKSRWFLDARDWLVHKATGRFTTTAESANLTWAMETRPGREGWSTKLADMSGIEVRKLPEIVDATETVGTLTSAAAEDLQLPASLPVLGGTADLTASALGSGEVEDGALHISIATSSWISGFMNGRRLNVPNSYATITSGLGFRPILVASQENAGSALDWIARLTGAPAETAFGDLGEPQKDDPFFMPWLAGERVPVDNEKLRGTLHGLSLHHDAKALRRAAIEGVAFNLRWAYSRVLREKGVRSDGPLTIVGGGASNPAFAATLANTLDREIRVGEARHAAMLGTATLAAPLMGWADSPWTASARLRKRYAVAHLPNRSEVSRLEARYAKMEKIRRNTLRSYRS